MPELADDYKIQINSNINGDLVNMRAGSGEELKEVLEGFAEHSPDIFKNLGDVKQAALVNGVFSGNAAPANQATQSAPKAAANTAPGAIPSCPTHGQMKDMRGKRTKAGEPMRNRFYCTKFGCTDVKPQGEWIE